MSVLVPTYIPSIPLDPQASTDSGYSIALSSSNVYLEAPCTEIGFSNQPGYSTTTPVDAFVGSIPLSHTPSVASGSCTTGGGGAPTVYGPAAGYALNFNGNSWISVPASDNFTLSIYTIEFWIKTNTTSGGQYLFGWDPSGDPQMYIGDGVIHFRTQFPSLVGTIPINNGEWHHVAVTSDGTTITLWIDGNSDGSITPSEVGSYGGNLNIGNWGMLPLEGIIDEFRVSNKVRYTGPFTPTSLNSDGNTVGFWKFDDGSGGNGGSVIDSSGHSHTGIIEGDPTWVTSP